MTEIISEKKFLLLKKRLDALHYCQPFTVDSASLIEQLLNDLIRTTEGFQALKKTIEDLKAAGAKAEQKLEPLMRENRKLLKENNDLHNEMIRVKEAAEFKEGRWNNNFKSLEGDKADLKHVIQLKDATIDKLQEETHALRKKLELLVKKQYLGHGKGLENVPADLRALMSSGSKTAKFEITKPLKANEGEIGTESFKRTEREENKAWAQTVHQAEERVNELKEELKRSAEATTELEERIRQLEIQVINRDREIKRLQAKLEVGDGAEKLSTEYNIKTNSEKIEKLNAQIDFLTKENFGLETSMKEMKRQLSMTDHVRTQNLALDQTIKDVTLKNDELKDTLRNKDRVLEKMRETRAVAESEAIDKKNRQIEELETEVLRLSKRFEETLADNSRMKLESSQAGQTISAYNSDKLMFNEILQELKQAKTKLETKLEETQFDLEKKTLENQRLLDDLNMAQGKVQSLQRDLDLLQLNATRHIEDQKYINEVSSTLRGRITELESENLSLHSQKKELETQVERANKLREHVEEQLERLKNESYKSKASFDTTSTAKQRYQTLYEEAQKDIEFLKKENKSLSVQLLEEQKTITELDLKRKEYFHDLKMAQDKIKSLELDAQLLHEQLAVKLQELRRIDTHKTELEREVSSLKMSTHKLEDQVDRNRRLKEELKALEDEKARDVRRHEELNAEIRELRDKITRLEETVRNERETNAGLISKIERLESETEGFDLNLRKLREREHEYNRLLEDLESGKRREKELHDEVERLKREVRNQEGLISSGTRQVESFNQRRDELLSEIKILRDEVNNLKAAENDSKTKSIRLQEKINNYEITIADLKDEKSKSERLLAGLEDDIRRLKSELESERRSNSELNSQVQQFKTLAESLERTKEELMARLQNKNNERSLEEGEKMRLHDDIKALRNKILALEEELQEARTTLIEIDREKDGLQGELDTKTVTLERVRRRCDEQEDEVRRLKDKSVDFMASSDVNSMKVVDLEAQLRDLTRKNRTLLDENSEVKHLLNAKESEASNLLNDVQVLTRENQNLTYKLNSLLDEKDKTRDALGSANTQERVMRQTLRAAELEKEDILNNYKAVCLENERLKRNNEELADENQEQFRKIKQYEKEMSYTQGESHQLHNRESQLQNELATYERNISQLNKRLEQSEFRNKELQEAKEKLLRDLTQIRHLNEGAEYSKDDAQRNNIRLEQEKARLENEVRDLRIEQEVLKRQVEDERRRGLDLERALDDAKSVQFKQDRNVQRLENEKTELKSDIENCQRRITNLQNSLREGTGTSEGFTGRDTSQSIDFSAMQRSTKVLETRLNEKSQEIDLLRNEQRGLRDENARLRSSLYKIESEKSDLERKARLQDSFDSTLRSSYGKLFEGTSSRERFDTAQDRPRFESVSFKREQESLSSQYVKDKAKSFQKEYRGYSPDRSGKK